MKARKPTLHDLNCAISESELVRAAIIEAVHRYYFDNCFDPITQRPFGTKEAKQIFSIYQSLHCSNPDWRFKIKSLPIRYNAWEKTNALNIDGKPEKRYVTILPIKFEAPAGSEGEPIKKI